MTRAKRKFYNWKSWLIRLKHKSWLRSLLVDLTLFTNHVTSNCIHCDCRATMTCAKSKFIVGKVDLSNWSTMLWGNLLIMGYVHGLWEVKKELGQSFDQTTSNEAGEWNIERDRTNTQTVTLWWIPNLCDWRSYEWG